MGSSFSLSVFLVHDDFSLNRYGYRFVLWNPSIRKSPILTLLFMPNSLYGFILNFSCYPIFGFSFLGSLNSRLFWFAISRRCFREFWVHHGSCRCWSNFWFFFCLSLVASFLLFFVSFVVIVGLFICQIFFALMDNHLCISMHIDLIFIFLLLFVLIFLFLEKN